MLKGLEQKLRFWLKNIHNSLPIVCLESQWVQAAGEQREGTCNLSLDAQAQLQLGRDAKS